MSARIHCHVDGKAMVTLTDPEDELGVSINEQLVLSGLAISAKKSEIFGMTNKMSDGQSVVKLAEVISRAQDSARKNREGIWRYGDIAEEDDE